MSSFRLLSQQVFLVGFGVFELFFFPPCGEFFFCENCVRVTIYEKNETRMKERKVSTIQRSTRSATRSPTRSLTRTRTRCPTRGFGIPSENKWFGDLKSQYPAKPMNCFRTRCTECNESKHIKSLKRKTRSTF